MPDEARTLTHTLLGQRARGGSICPSEVARALASAGDSTFVDWRDAMPEVHAAIDQLLAEGSVRLTWKGALLATRAGPYRIRREE
ncbi:DUF3253 domain-containing protein [Sphingomonas glacialis]|uniref:DUF3253 domain-containing protein n=1 Tax=Sphingomonas glacialis TaxID=658225 RepID=UPI001F5039BD|nr:DUF3253 domain-containing protein [Sphingomonas glacialis]